MRSEEKEKVGVGYYDYLFIFGFKKSKIFLIKFKFTCIKINIPSFLTFKNLEYTERTQNELNYLKRGGGSAKV